MKIVPSAWYKRPTDQVARDLLGKMLVRTVNGVSMSGIITETEAYTSKDPACHAFKGKTVRNQALFGPVGHSYVYFIYGNHFCLNIVAHNASVEAGGVLIRALHPLNGVEIMRGNRPGHADSNLASGPGKLTQALQITCADADINVTKMGALYVTEGVSVASSTIQATPRIGISQGKDLLWRFVIQDNLTLKRDFF